MSRAMRATNRENARALGSRPQDAPRKAVTVLCRVAQSVSPSNASNSLPCPDGGKARRRPMRTSPSLKAPHALALSGRGKAHRWSTCTSGLLPMNNAPRTCSAGISSGKLKGCVHGRYLAQQ